MSYVSTSVKLMATTENCSKCDELVKTGSFNTMILMQMNVYCKESDLYLPGDVGYNVENSFSNQARVALRLSHFLSNFLQNVDLYEEYGNLRGDRLLNTEQIFGEVCMCEIYMCFSFQVVSCLHQFDAFAGISLVI